MSGKRCIDVISEALVFCIVLMDNGLYTTIRIGYHMQGNDLSVTSIMTNRRIRWWWYLSLDGEVTWYLKNSNEGRLDSSDGEDQ